VALAPGTRLGPYEITALIGAGGMGEVYRARDTTLNRDVALKILPAEFTTDPERLARFKREAQVLAALDHPNIGAIYGFEDTDGAHALILQLVEGPTLADRIAVGPMPIDEALPIAKQIADALQAAHQQGIIHRDLKPANIKVTPDGRVKVLDFGLAKLLEPDTVASARSGALTNVPTITTPAMTTAGVILGTAAYMSPEQARGRPADKRSDIWAFGVVLHEMLSGQQLFTGETMTDVLAAVVRQEPAWDRIPVNVTRLLKRCVERDPKKRLQDLGDAWLLLDEPSASVERAGPAAWIAATVLVGIAAVVAAGGWWRATRPITTMQPLMRLDVDLGGSLTFDTGGYSGTHVVLSPDGTRIVYVSQGRRLFTRRLDQAAATPLTGAEGAYAPFFSPDGQWVAFFSQGKLKKISVEGGAAVPVCDAISGRGGSWADDGTIVAALTSLGPLSRIPESGGRPMPVTELRPGELAHRWPQVLPGSTAVLFTAMGVEGHSFSFDTASIEIVSLSDHKRKTVHAGGTFGRVLPSGHLLYVNRGTLFAVPFDLDRLETRGTPVPIQDGIDYSPTQGYAQLDFSRTGTLVYTGGSSLGLITAQWMNARGETKPFIGKPGEYQYPALSPDGTRLAYADAANADLWVFDSERNNPIRLTFGGLNPTNPLWTSDGRYVLFQSLGGMFWTRSDRGGKAQPLTQSKNPQFPWSFSADGKRLGFIEVNPDTGYDLWTMPIERDDSGIKPAGRPEVFLNSSADERYISFSPDGKWIAYASNESGMFQIYVRAFPDRGDRWLVGNGTYPVWARNRGELFFRAEDDRIMVASYAVKGDTFIRDEPRVWSNRRLADFGIVGTRTFDLAPDGSRVVALLPAESDQNAKARNPTFLLNFFDEVRRRTAKQ
jgi:serine/threonine-protein kinase